jgi:hypothetical protein
MRVRMKCSACQRDVTGSPKAVLHVPYEEFGRVERESASWKQKHKENDQGGLGVVSLAELMTYPGPARWQVHCDRCNPHKDERGDMCDGCYWVSLDRCTDAVDLLYWTAHLMGKTWLRHTNWASFIRMAAESTGRRDP